MKIFWPHRPKAKGFSAQNLAFKYGLRISKVSPGQISNQLLDDRNLISTKKEGKNIPIGNLYIKRIHWANRDFSEYKDAA